MSKEALLPGYRRRVKKGELFSEIIEHLESSIRGKIIEGISDGDVKRLDDYEDELYYRKQVLCPPHVGTKCQTSVLDHSAEFRKFKQPPG